MREHIYDQIKAMQKIFETEGIKSSEDICYLDINGEVIVGSQKEENEQV